MLKKIIIGSILLVLVTIIILIFITDIDKITEDEKKVKRVYTEKPRIEEISSKIKINGKVRNQFEVIDASVMQGKVDKVLVKIGDVVKIGDPLLKISTLGETDTINYQMSQLEAAISEVAVVYDQILQEKIKIDKLYASQGIAKQAVISINNELTQYSTKLEQLKKQKYRLAEGKSNINHMSLIKSAVNGTVKEVTLETNSYITNDDFLKIEKDNTTEVLMYVTEKYLNSVAINKKVEVTVNNKIFQGTINRIMTIDESGLFYPVVVKLNTPVVLNHGRNAIITIPLYENSKAIVVSNRSIIRYNEESYVFIVEHGKAIKRTVKTGKNKKDKTEILEGLTLKDSVIVRGQFSVKDGDSIDEK